MDDYKMLPLAKDDVRSQNRNEERRLTISIHIDLTAVLLFLIGSFLVLELLRLLLESLVPLLLGALAVALFSCAGRDNNFQCITHAPNRRLGCLPTLHPVDAFVNCIDIKDLQGEQWYSDPRQSRLSEPFRPTPELPQGRARSPSAMDTDLEATKGTHNKPAVDVIATPEALTEKSEAQPVLISDDKSPVSTSHGFRPQPSHPKIIITDTSNRTVDWDGDVDAVTGLSPPRYPIYEAEDLYPVQTRWVPISQRTDIGLATVTQEEYDINEWGDHEYGYGADIVDDSFLDDTAMVVYEGQAAGCYNYSDAKNNHHADGWLEDGEQRTEREVVVDFDKFYDWEADWDGEDADLRVVFKKDLARRKKEDEEALLAAATADHVRVKEKSTVAASPAAAYNCSPMKKKNKRKPAASSSPKQNKPAAAVTTVQSSKKVESPMSRVHLEDISGNRRKGVSPVMNGPFGKGGGVGSMLPANSPKKSPTIKKKRSKEALATSHAKKGISAVNTNTGGRTKDSSVAANNNGPKKHAGAASARNNPEKDSNNNNSHGTRLGRPNHALGDISGNTCNGEQGPLTNSSKKVEDLVAGDRLKQEIAAGKVDGMLDYARQLMAEKGLYTLQ